jgi:hypothetical protein
LFYSSTFSNHQSQSKDQIDSNILLWRKRCKNIPDLYDICQAVYSTDDDLNNPNSTNSFIQYLHNTRDKEAIEYLIFARKCSQYNTIIYDPWERSEFAKVPQRGYLINHALAKAKTITDNDLQLRYAFLAIRLSYYNDDRLNIGNIYNNYFSFRETKSIIDYWSMYFMTFAETDSIKRIFSHHKFFLLPLINGRIFFPIMIKTYLLKRR